MICFIPSLIIVTAARWVWGPLPALRRRRPFKLGAAWYRIDEFRRHAEPPDPTRDWVVA